MAQCILDSNPEDDFKEVLDQQSLITEQRERIKNLEKLVVFLSSRMVTLDMLSMKIITPDDRMDRVNLYWDYLVRKIPTIKISLGLGDECELTTLQEKLLPTLDCWNRAVTVDELMISMTSNINRTRPFWTLKNFIAFYQNGAICPKVMALLSRYDTRIPKLRNKMQVMKTTYEDQLAAYLALIGYVKILHLVDTDSFKLHYHLQGPAVIDYEDSETYKEKVYGPNNMYLREVRKREIEDEDSIKIKIAKH